MRLRALTYREKQLIAAGSILLILGGVGAGTFLPVVSRLGALKVEVAEGERFILRLRDLESQEAALDQRLNQLREAVALEGLDPRIPFGASEVLMLLQSAEDIWGLSLEQVTFGSQDKGVFAVQVTGTGGYREVSDFLQALRMFPRTSSISLAVLRPAKTGVRFELQVGFQLNPVLPSSGPAAPRPAARLRVPPLPGPSEGRENPFTPAR